MWKPGFRDEIWSRLDQGFDLIVVGGGITGAGILLEATRAGLRTLLVEARDFSAGTSSRSTKLVHGGLRYLRQAQFRVTRESVLERERLLREASGLVSPLGFYLTGFHNDRMPTWMFGAGLAIYDLIARKWEHERLRPEELVEKLPALRGARLRGGYHYYDAQTDDARLTVRVLREAVRHGGTALSYARASGLLRNGNGLVQGIVVRDEAHEGGPRELEVRARVVINATGVWADGLRKHVGGERRLRAIRGSHAMFAASRLPLTAAVSLLHPRDGRAVFALPWEGVTMIGTTDVDHRHDLEQEPSISAGELEYILEAAHHAFPEAELSEKDVRSSFSGVRGVIDTGADNPSKESRDHALWNENGMLTVTGGKLTTFRMMALDTLKATMEAFPALKVPRRGRIFDDVPEDGGGDTTGDPVLRARLLGRYGGEAATILAGAREELAQIEDVPAVWAELRFVARREGVVHLDDLLLRRVRLGLLLPEGGQPLLDRIGAIVRPELGWDDARWASEVERYRAIWRKHYGPTP